jgi:peptide/nickel transport system ATP-binding protein
MLDVSIRLEILNLLDFLKRDRNLALLYITHDLATARHFSTEIMVMYGGEIVEHGPADEVILRPAHPYTQVLAAAVPNPSTTRTQLAAERRERLAVRPQRGNETLRGGQGCPFRGRCAFAMEICAVRPMSVEVGPRHVTRCWLHDPVPTRPTDEVP